MNAPKDDDTTHSRREERQQQRDQRPPQQSARPAQPPPATPEEAAARAAFGKGVGELRGAFDIETGDAGVTFRCTEDDCGAAFKILHSMTPKTPADVERLVGPIRDHAKEHADALKARS